MVSPELLRRYPYFGVLADAHLKEIAMIAEEATIEKGAEIFEECGLADKLYLLQDGSVDLYFKVVEEYRPDLTKEFMVGEINPGEVFAISALIEPYSLNATAKVTKTCKVIVIDAVALRDLCEKDPLLGYQIMQQTAKVLMERLGYMRLQLAAATH